MAVKKATENVVTAPQDENIVQEKLHDDLLSNNGITHNMAVTRILQQEREAMGAEKLIKQLNKAKSDLRRLTPV